MLSDETARGEYYLPTCSTRAANCGEDMGDDSRKTIFVPGGTSPPENVPGRLVRPERYTGHNLHPAYTLRYDWTGWPTNGTRLPPQTAAIACDTAPLWEHDGLRLLTPFATAEKVQLLFSVTP